jgi:hypothetical protein
VDAAALMLQLLRAFGIDVEARIADVRTRLEQRFDRATGELQRTAVDVALIAVVAAAAGAAAVAAFGVGLVALYRWVAELDGAYAGLGAVAAVLVALSVILAIVAGTRLRSVRRPRLSVPGAPAVERPIEADAQAESARLKAESARLPPPPAKHAVTAQQAVTAQPASGAAWSELAAFMLPLLMRVPAGEGNALAARLRERGSGSLHGALNATANLMRDGERGTLFVAVAGAIFAGWLMTRHARDQQRSD